MGEVRVTDERLAAFFVPGKQIDSYGRDDCGCTWDSGPYDVPCEKHDREALVDDLLADAADALGPSSPVAERIGRLRASSADTGEEGLGSARPCTPQSP